MSFKKWNTICLDIPASNDGGGSSGGSILTSFGGGSGSEGTPGGSNPPANPIGEGVPAPAPSASAAPKSGQPQDWKMGLPAELQEDASLRKFTDVSALASGYINAQKLIGADKVVVPSKHATDEDWRGVYKKLGLPEDIKDYSFNLKEGATIDKDFTDAFKNTAYNIGILPKQAQALADWFAETNSTAEQKIIELSKTDQEAKLNALKADWGKSYDSNIAKAQNVLKEYANPELLSYLNDTGLGNDPKIITLLTNIGKKLYGEADIVKGDGGGLPSVGPAEAKKQVDSIMSNLSHPYHVKSHPGHRAAVKEVETLFNKMYPS